MLLTVLGHFMVGKTAVLNVLAGKRAPKPEERTVQVTSDVLEDKQSGISFSVRESAWSSAVLRRQSSLLGAAHDSC